VSLFALSLLLLSFIARSLAKHYEQTPWKPSRRFASNRDGDTDEASIYGQINAWLRAHPGEPLDYGALPPVPPGRDGTMYHPGLRDLLPGEADEAGCNHIVAAIRAVGGRRITSWRSLEQKVRSIEPGPYHEKVLRKLRNGMVSLTVRDLFAEMAVRSTDYAAVKWGIIVASTGASLAELEMLLPLARHSEFTYYICSGLHRGSTRDGVHMLLIEELITMTEGWGLYQAITHTAQIRDLKNDWELQRNCVIRGMRHGGSARSNIAEIIMRNLDAVILLDRATDDTELAGAMLELLEAIIWTPEPPGMLGELDGAERVARRYVEWLESLPPTIGTLRGLRSLAIALANDDLPLENREVLFSRTRDIFLQQVDPVELAEAIRTDHMREVALQIVVELELADMAPVVLEDFRKRPSALNIDVLGHIGQGEYLHLLLESLPDRRTLQERREIARDAMISGELHNSSAMYAAAIRHMGKLRHPEALASIKTAAADFHPWVRSAALYAMGTLQRWTLDAESRQLIRTCLTDSHDFVREAARQTAIYHHLNFSVGGMAGSLSGEDIGISMN